MKILRPWTDFVAQRTFHAFNLFMETEISI